MQWVRFFFILPLVVVWGLNFYVNVKKCIMYLNFWALTATLLYLLFIFPSAGRLVVEEKMTNAGKNLEEKERTRSWKLALFFNSLAWPLSVTSAVLFSVFFMKEQICATYFDFGFAYWRGVVVFIATYFPIVVLTIDFLVNRIVFSYKHLLFNILTFLLFVFATFIGSVAQDRPAYANHLAFRRVYGNNYTEPTNYSTLSDPAWAKEKAQDCMQHVFDWKALDN